MTIEIKSKDGKWTVNGKQYADLNYFEKKFMDGFFNEIKSKQESINQ